MYEPTGRASAGDGRNSESAANSRSLIRSLKMGVYEDNFGFWDIDEPEESAFFEHVQRQGVLIACERCQRSVRLILPKNLRATRLRERPRMRRADFDERTWLQSNSATGPSPSVTTDGSFPKRAALSGGTR